ncbi:MAG: monovalent cation/H(+) antiporter subunit G, partial [Candidatus Hydrogenedentales bacterium]
MTTLQLIVANALVLLGSAAITLAVAGIIRIPDPQAKIHAAAKGMILGVLVILSATFFVCSSDVIVRAFLVGLFLLLTSPVGAHALAKLAAQLSEEVEVTSPQ